jgi:hypothetical protein
VHAYSKKEFQHPLSQILFSVFDKLPIVALVTLFYHTSIHGYDDVSSIKNSGLYEKVMNFSCDSFHSPSSSNLFSVFPKPSFVETRRLLLFHGGLPNSYPIVDSLIVIL